MSRFSLLLMGLCTIFASAFASPLPNATVTVEMASGTNQYYGTVSSIPYSALATAHDMPQATYYYTGLGACGYKDHDSEHIVAVSLLYTPNYIHYTHISRLDGRKSL